MGTTENQTSVFCKRGGQEGGQEIVPSQYLNEDTVEKRRMPNC